MKMKRKYVNAAVLILCLVLSSYWGLFGEKDVYTHREIHHNLYNLYFPDDTSLTPFQRLKRIFYREVIWHKIKDNPELIQIIDPIHNGKIKIPPKVLAEFKDVTRLGFAKVSAERQDNFMRSVIQEASPELRKYLFNLRQIWLYIVYSSPLVNELAGVAAEKSNPIYDVTLDLPPTKLRINGEHIEHKDGEIDYLILGSGPAGSLIAHELTRSIPNCRVVLIESGPFVKPLSAITEFDSDLMESHNDRHSDTGGLVLRNGATVGGGTTVNIDLAFAPTLPQIRAKLTNWVDTGALPKDFFHKDNSDWEKLEKAYDWVKEKLHTRHVDLDEVNQNNLLLLRGHPLAKTYDLNSRPLGPDVHIPKISSTEALIVPALKGGPDYKGTLSLIPNAVVREVIFTESNGSKRAQSVRIRFSAPLNRPNVYQDLNQFSAKPGSEFILKARNVIISAGTLGSSEILLRSDIKNDNIGRGIIIHPSMGIVGLFDREINVLEGLSASVYAPSPDGGYFFEAMAVEPRFIALVHPGSGKDIIQAMKNYKKLGGFGLMLVDNVSPDNQVYVSDKTNLVEIKYHISDSDKNRMRQGLEKGAEILFDQGAKEVFIPTAEDINGSQRFTPLKSKGDIHEKVQNLKFTEGLNYISSAHMQGSNKLGLSPNSSVTSPRFKVWDRPRGKEIDNLYVCDSSVFPTSVGANPMQSIYTISKLFVDQLIVQALNKNIL